MSNPSMDNLFLDPTWQDPDVSMAEGSSQGLPAFATPANMARPSSTVQDSGADDPFSQLSLSRGTSGETLHADCGHTSGKGLAHIASYCIAGSAHLWLRACFYRQKKCRHRKKIEEQTHIACSLQQGNMFVPKLQRPQVCSSSSEIPLRISNKLCSHCGFLSKSTTMSFDAHRPYVLQLQDLRYHLSGCPKYTRRAGQVVARVACGNNRQLQK